MAEYNDQTYEASPARLPGEVVLRYEAPAPEPVVERYVQPVPLPGRGGTVPPAPGEPPKRKRSHRGLWIFLLCVALLLTSMAGKALLSWALDRIAAKADEAHFHYEYRVELPKAGAERPSLARYPNGDDVRLRCAETHGEALTIQQIYERVNPCTVLVGVATSDTSMFVGTGVIFTEDGYILTNAHVVQDGTEAVVALADGTVYYDVKLVGLDETNDLAVLKIEAEGLPVAEFGDSDALTVGDTVYAIGNPLGIRLRGTLTDGIVSAINRDVRVDGVTMTLIQTNAALNSGNSGGPLINVYGQIVGINTVKMGNRVGERSSISVEGLGFAIPVSLTAWVVDDLIAYGEVRGEPVLGIVVEEKTTETGEKVLRVSSVTKDGACDAAGIVEGDVIVGAEGERTETIGDLLRIRRRFRAGEEMTMELNRDGARMSVTVTLQTEKK